MKYITLRNLSASVLIIVLFAFPAFSQQLKTEKDRLSYALAINIIQSFKAQGIEINEAVFFQGVKDVLHDKKPKLTREEAGKILADFSSKAQVRRQMQNEKNLKVEQAAGKKFHAAKKKEKSVVSLPSGLQYKILKKGAGKKPSVTDKVKVDYAGTLIDGTEFDSSYKRGTPVVFPLNGVIRGWTEVLQLMPEKSVWEVYIPSDLAYGANPPQGSPIKAGSTLIFKIELHSIEK